MFGGVVVTMCIQLRCAALLHRNLCLVRSVCSQYLDLNHVCIKYVAVYVLSLYISLCCILLLYIMLVCP